MHWAETSSLALCSVFKTKPGFVLGVYKIAEEYARARWFTSGVPDTLTSQLYAHNELSVICCVIVKIQDAHPSKNQATGHYKEK